LIPSGTRRSPSRIVEALRGGQTVNDLIVRAGVQVRAYQRHLRT
jgi:hypothetical protein